VASMRRARKNFRKEVLRLISSGDGNIETLKKLADGFFGEDVGYKVQIAAFLNSEIANALAQLRNEGLIESIGKKWKVNSELTGDDVTVISARRMKRLRGELKAEGKLAHEHGRLEEAAIAGTMLNIVSSRLQEETADADKDSLPVA